jgi:hypothetical protein
VSAGVGIGLDEQDDNEFIILNQGVRSFNNSTGEIEGVSSLNGATGSIGISGGNNIQINRTGNTFVVSSSVSAGVASLNSLTGTLGLSAGNFITITPAGNTLVISSQATIDAVSSFNGKTGNVQGVSFAYGISGIGISGGTGTIFISNTGVREIKANQNHFTTDGETGSVNIALADNIVGPKSIYSDIDEGLTLGGQFSGGNPTTTLSLRQTGALIQPNLTVNGALNVQGTLTTSSINTDSYLGNVVTSFNGKTGTVQGISFASAGVGITLSAGTGSVQITNIGVISVRGLSGPVGLSGGSGINVNLSGNTIVLSAGISAGNNIDISQVGNTYVISSTSGSSNPQISQLQPNSGPTGTIITRRGGGWTTAPAYTVAMPLPNLGAIASYIGGITYWNRSGLTGMPVVLGDGTFLICNTAYREGFNLDGIFAATDDTDGNGIVSAYEFTIRQGSGLTYPSGQYYYSQRASPTILSGEWSSTIGQGGGVSYRHNGWAMKLSGVTSGGVGPGSDFGIGIMT